MAEQTIQKLRSFVDFSREVRPGDPEGCAEQRIVTNINKMGRKFTEKRGKLRGICGSAGSAFGPLAVGVFGLQSRAGVISAILVPGRAPQCCQMIQRLSMLRRL